MKPAFSSLSRICDLLLLFFFFFTTLVWWGKLQEIYLITYFLWDSHCFSLSSWVIFSLATLVHSGSWKDTDGALRESFIFTYLMNNNVIFSIFIRYWISNFWIGSPRLSHSSWLFSLQFNFMCFIYFFHLSPFSEICIANIV